MIGVARLVACVSLVASIGIAASIATASAQPRGIDAHASLEVDADILAQSTESADKIQLASFGVALRALIGKHNVFYALGFGYRFGTTSEGGFAYRVELLPVGVGVGVSDLIHLGIYAGVGLDGVSGRLPLSGIFPLEARLDLRLGNRLAVGGYGRGIWTTKQARENGALTSDRVDELSAGLRLRWSRRHPLPSRAYGRDGYYLAGLVQENLGTRFVGVAFGYSLDMGLLAR